MNTVLLIDDDHVSTFLLTKALEKLGSVKKIYSATNGRQAIDLIKDLTDRSVPMPDIIFLDINMPVMDGFGFLKAYQGMGLTESDSKIVMVTSSDSQDDRKRASELGAVNYMVKPVSMENLATLLPQSYNKN